MSYSLFACGATRMTVNGHALGSAATKGTQEFFMNNIYESFMYIYGHSCSVADKNIHGQFK